ncbi:hypothetical protein IWW38_004866 [Coemansia aciculifera]|uniref:Uncharacterized protein n=1 Tax=Coemansia aciculifera TaxID=417176 RepID=A0ACC1LWT5_9FUNG|nr:hypothetical protein IWW38_004866 [Coemansia aciculifera]
MSQGRGWGAKAGAGAASAVQLSGADAPGDYFWPGQQAEAARVMMDRMALLSNGGGGGSGSGDESASYEQSVLALVDSEHDEVYSPATSSDSSSHHHNNRHGVPPRSGAIGSQRTAAAPVATTASQQCQSSAPTTAPVSPSIHGVYQPYNISTAAKQHPLGPWSATDASPSSSCSMDNAASNSYNGGWDSLLTNSSYAAATTNLNQPQQQPSAAMDAWQQYQMEQQRKFALQQQLDQQQKIQMHLQQQLFVRQQQSLQQQWNFGQQQQQQMRAPAASDIYAAYNSMSPRMAAVGQPPGQSNMSMSYPWAMATGFSAGTGPSANGSSSVAAAAALSSNSSSASKMQSLQHQPYEWCS